MQKKNTDAHTQREQKRKMKRAVEMALSKSNSFLPSLKETERDGEDPHTHARSLSLSLGGEEEREIKIIERKN